ncbi:MAG: LysR family transcriptional regulator [Cyanobacteria bacterium P01_D01_bin.123]
MRLEQLQAFLTIAERGSFQQAARQCGVTQSTISRQIQGLEAQLGMPLFHRSAQARLTVAGEHLLPRARRIWQEWQSATTDIQDLLQGNQSELCVAAIPSVCAYRLPPVVQAFCRQQSDVQLRVTTLGSDRAIKVLKDGLVDLAIVMENPLLANSPGAAVDLLYEEAIYLLAPANHPLSARARVTWPDLSPHPQVIFKEGYGMQRLVRDQFDRLKLPYQVALELNALDAFRSIVRQGDFIALLPFSAIADAAEDPALVIRPIVDFSGHNLTRQVVLVTTSDRLLIPTVRQFRQLVRQYVQKPQSLASPPGTIAAPVSVAR